MKQVEITSSMRTLGGVFYPKGYAFVMFPTVEHAQQVVSQSTTDAMLLTPRQVLVDVGQVKDDSDVELPAVGTEGATVRKFIDLARKGHHAVMVKIDSDEEAESLMVVARAASFSYGQRYHLLAMEDLE
ncbi:MAG: RNA-binding protein [Polaromonas sp.]|nr:RNA-binding protein [Polaromonas sp.]